MALEVAGWFLSGVISRLLDLSINYLEDQIKWQTGMKQEILQMREYLPKIQAVVDAAESGQMDLDNPKLQAFQTWLGQLKNALYEADDVLDEFEYEQLEKQVKNQPNDNKLHSTFNTIQKNVQSSAKRAFKQDPRLKKLNEVLNTLTRIAGNTEEFLQLVQIHYKQHQRYQDQMKHHEPGIIGSKIVGRYALKKTLLDSLRKPADRLSVISIVGMGGMGKTTLARLVYDSATKDFDEKIWVNVSNKFDAKNLVRMMFKAVEKEKDNRSEDLANLQKELMEKLKNMKFLLVLDDVWNYDNIVEWENLLAPLQHAKKGSMILLTTRIYEVAEMAKRMIGVEKLTIQLKGIKEDTYLSLFNHYAFMGVDPNSYKKLLEIGKQIASSLGGNPLAAKVIGNMLRYNLDEDYWLDILNSDVLIQNEGGEYILRVLKLSYNYLPLHLKSCFAYCGMFPDGHEFDKEDIVRMWIAAGLVQQEARKGRRQRLEDVVLKNFDELVSRSLFDKIEDEWRHRTFYKMHDLIHELAQLVSSQESFRVMNSELASRIPPVVRHLCLNAGDANMLKQVGKLQNLHTLAIMSSDYRGEWMHCAVLADVLKATKSIRVLLLDVKNMIELPDVVGGLRHLRYLNLKGTKITQLPPSICELYHLMFLSYGYNHGMVDFSRRRFMFPEQISNLMKLRQLGFPNYCWDAAEPITGIGMLTQLQEFDGFHVRNEKDSSKGYKFAELERMIELRGVTISGLSHVAEAKEVTGAKLKEKSKLSRLTLDWGNDDQLLNLSSEQQRSKQAQLLDCLQPHQNLKMLQIAGYGGGRSATWMRAEIVPNLEKIWLKGCRDWQKLPCLGRLPHLKYLHLEDMNGVKELGEEFHGEGNGDGGFLSLEELHVDNLEKLEEWPGPSTAAEKGESIYRGSWFPNLRMLSIHRCPRLKALPPIPTSLKRLDVWKVGLTSMPGFWNNNGGGETWSSMEEIEIGYLKDLEAWFWPTTAALEELELSFPSLRVLQVCNCPKLSTLPFKNAVDEGVEGEEVIEDKEEEPCEFPYS